MAKVRAVNCTSAAAAGEGEDDRSAPIPSIQQRLARVEKRQLSRPRPPRRPPFSSFYGASSPHRRREKEKATASERAGAGGPAGARKKTATLCFSRAARPGPGSLWTLPFPALYKLTPVPLHMPLWMPR